MRLNGIIAGMSILTTVSTPVPIKIPVNMRLSGIITSVISTEPTASPAAMPFLPPIFLYIRPDARTSTPDAQKCMRKPIMWLDELTVMAWIAEARGRSEQHRTYKHGDIRNVVFEKRRGGQKRKLDEIHRHHGNRREHRHDRYFAQVLS